MADAPTFGRFCTCFDQSERETTLGPRAEIIKLTGCFNLYSFLLSVKVQLKLICSRLQNEKAEIVIF